MMEKIVHGFMALTAGFAVGAALVAIVLILMGHQS